MAILGQLMFSRLEFFPALAVWYEVNIEISTDLRILHSNLLNIESPAPDETPTYIFWSRRFYIRTLFDDLYRSFLA